MKQGNYLHTVLRATKKAEEVILLRLIRPYTQWC